MTRLVTNNQLQCCRLSLRWTWNELTRVWKSPNTSKREKISVTAEEAEETKKKIQKNTKKPHLDSWTVYCSWEAMLLRVTADHSDTDPLFSVVPGINQTFRVGVWEAGNMGKWTDSTLAWVKKWWLDNWPQIAFKAAALVGCFRGQNTQMGQAAHADPLSTEERCTRTGPQSDRRRWPQFSCEWTWRVWWFHSSPMWPRGELL